MPVVFDPYDLQWNDIALVDHLFRVPDAAIHQLRHVHQPLDRTGQACERAERHQLRDHRRHDVADGVLRDQVLPLFRRRTPD